MNHTFRPSWYARHHDAEPVVRDGLAASHWITRGKNFVVVVSQVQSGAVLARVAQEDEYVLLVPAGMFARVEAGDDAVDVPGDTLVIVPPGSSRVVASGEGHLYRVFTSRAQDLATVADNAALYAGEVPQVAPLEDWPAPVDGYRLRTYPLARFTRPGIPGRLFRTRNLMVNVFETQTQPRDPRKMTPHSHDDFEQGSLAILGDYVHHLRYPWVPDMTTWREDEHGCVGSPSLIIIPPRAIHTTQSIGESPSQLVDVFAPPRDDFSLVPGLCCNADVYPLPDRLRAAHDAALARMPAPARAA